MLDLVSVSTPVTEVGGAPAWVMARGDPGWPAGLEHLVDPPVRLWLAGRHPPEAPAVAVVGARRATLGGLEVAHRIGRDLASVGIQVVSGLARGIDSAAHRGAIDGGGTTVAVLGSGIDRCHPVANLPLRDRILAHGCLVAEDAPGTEAAAFRFPRRNRLIAALSVAVVVVEAAERSGALITARLAADLGREVLAAPGSVLNDRSAGTNRLLRDGAGIWLGLEDLIGAVPELADRAPPRGASEARGTPLDPPLARLLELIGTDPVHPDALAVELAEPAQAVAAQLSTLELLGEVQTLPGGLVVRASRGAARGGRDR
jgi:DNA processing protein